MARTRTPGIRIDRNGRRIIDKEHHGVEIYIRLGPIRQEHAEQRLANEMARVDLDLKHKANPRPRFADCAARYLAQSQNKRSVDVAAWHVRLLTSYVGTLDIRRIHDGTLERFVADRVASGVTATTINRSLEVARTILNRAACAYRDSDGRPWLEGMPPLITMLPEAPRPPCPITWDEQGRLFSKLSARLARMVLFAVNNTGLRECNVCGLDWTWEVAVPEVGRSVFVRREACPPGLEVAHRSRPLEQCLAHRPQAGRISQRGKGLRKQPFPPLLPKSPLAVEPSQRLPGPAVADISLGEVLLL